MEEVTNPLKIAFADTYAFYVKAQNYHWNVEGVLFKQLHAFFEEIYEDVFGSIDSILPPLLPSTMYQYL